MSQPVEPFGKLTFCLPDAADRIGDDLACFAPLRRVVEKCVSKVGGFRVRIVWEAAAPKGMGICNDFPYSTARDEESQLYGTERRISNEAEFRFRRKAISAQSPSNPRFVLALYGMQTLCGVFIWLIINSLMVDFAQENEIFVVIKPAFVQQARTCSSG